jgi:hypothetical protein
LHRWSVEHFKHLKVYSPEQAKQSKAKQSKAKERKAKQS